MNLVQRYRRLSLWSRLGACGSVASIVSIPLAIILAILPFYIAVPHAATDTPQHLNDTRYLPEKDAPVVRPSPTVTFVDGERAVVDFSVTSHVEEADTAIVVFTCGTADNARDSLEGKVVSSVIARMEKLTLAEARQQRVEVEEELMASLSPFFKKVGLTLDHLSLKEFRKAD